MALPFDEDEYIIWRENPITSFIFDTMLSDEIVEAENYWFNLAFNKGNLCPILRAECHARIKLAQELIELNYLDLTMADENRDAH